jgi:two-component system, cell cycle sensor histidine kinase and response regulator CckA
MGTTSDDSEQVLQAVGLSYRDIFDGTSDAIFVHDERGRIVYVNNRACAMFACRQEEVHSLSISDLSDSQPPYSQSDAIAKVEQAVREGSCTFEWRSRRMTGELFWSEVALRACTVGERLCIIASVRDITGRKQIEQVLRESEEKFTKIFNSSSNAMALTHLASGAIVDVNSTWVNATGIAREAAVGKSALELGLWARAEDRDACIAALAHEHRVADFETTLMMNGRPRPHLISAEVIRMAADSFVLWEFRDISARKQYEQNLALMNFALDSVHEEAILIDEQARILYVNQETSRMLGYTREELVSLRVPDIDPDYSVERWPAHWRDLQQKRSLMFPGHHRTKDGRLVPVEISANYFEYEGRGYNLALVRDTSERKQAEQERERMQAQLVQAQKMDSIGRLAGGVAHDFNNMLGVILGHAELILETLPHDSPVRAEAQQIGSAARRSADLTRQLLAFARKQAIVPKVLDLNDTVEGMLKMLRRLIGENVDVVWQPGRGLGRIKIDPAQVDQILANLLLNARDAIADKGRVVISTENVEVGPDACRGQTERIPGNYVKLSVNDDGAGIDPQTLTQIFEPFFTTKGIGQGTGLGLATVYGIVHQNAGFLDVKSEPGHGTTFFIYFPRHAGSDDRGPEPEPSKPERGGGETILVVEDEPILLALLKSSLTRIGYNVLSTSAPEEAIHIASSHAGHIHLLVTDIVMPTMNGWDLAENLHKAIPGLKTLFISGHAADVLKDRGIMAESTHFLQKPFRLDQLAARVRQALA